MKFMPFRINFAQFKKQWIEEMPVFELLVSLEFFSWTVQLPSYSVQEWTHCFCVRLCKYRLLWCSVVYINICHV